MSERPDPEDIDVFVGGAELDPTVSIEIERIIEDYKKRPDYPLEAEEAERILASIGINAPDYGIPDAKSLLEHWHGCVIELLRRDSGQTNGVGAEGDELGVRPGSPKEQQN